jgi:hypothetical protein
VRTGLVCLLCLAAVPALAAPDKPPPLYITSAGYFLIVAGDDGVPVPVKLADVYDLRGGSVPPPTGGELSPLAKQVAAWADAANDPAGRAALKTVYGTVAQAVKDGKVGPEDVWKVLQEGTNEAFAATGTGEKWAGFRASVSEMNTQKVQAGELRTAAQLEAYLWEIVHGLAADGDTGAALSEDTIRQIVQAILAIIRDLVPDRPLPAPQ